MNSTALGKHVLAAYTTLRFGIATIALLFPLLLGIGGYLAGDIPLQDSMSAYYHASGTTQAPMRNWFVGVLFAVGAFLYLYKGFSKAENIALNCAGIMAVGVAVFPMSWGCVDDCSQFSMHGFCAVSFFLSIAFVSIRCASDTLHLVKDPAARKRFKLSYTVTGIAMVVSPVAAFLLTAVLRQHDRIIFFVETAGIAAFAAYWLLKSSEIAQTESDRLALRGELEI